jgi:3-phosphoshikimate 1-carboxyvinyltransferase
MITYDKVRSIRGEVKVPSDKSVSHRAFMLGAMAEGLTTVTDPLMSRDTIATMNAMKALGAEFEGACDGFVIKSDGYKNFKEPSNILDCENSGTTARLLTGVLAPAGIYSVLTGDDSLRKRPMGRVISPLLKMGARMEAASGGKLLPLTVLPSKMNPAELIAETKSAQVKSSILLAAAQIDGITQYTETAPTRNHSELMLARFGADISVNGAEISINGGKALKATEIIVPGDFSSAAFFIGAALMFEKSEVVLRNVGLNETRTGLLSALSSLGVKYEAELYENTAEPMGDLHIVSQSVGGGLVKGDIVANLIDELPLLAFLGMFASAPIEIRDAGELRVKESDRIASTVYNLRQLGAEVEEFEDGMKVFPLAKEPEKAELKSFHDHRIAMLSILMCKRFGQQVSVDEITSVDVSFPNFPQILEQKEVK